MHEQHGCKALEIRWERGLTFHMFKAYTTCTNTTTIEYNGGTTNCWIFHVSLSDWIDGWKEEQSAFR